MRVAVFRGPRPGVPWARVAGTDDDGVGFGIEARALPWGTAAVAPGFDLAGLGARIIRPGRCLDVAGRRAVLAVQAAHVAFDERTHPDFFTGFRVAGIELAHHPEFVAGAAVDQQDLAGLAVLDQGRRAGHGVAGGVIAELLLPDDLAGVLVQGDQLGVEGAEVDLVAEDRCTAVDHVTARANVVRQAVVVGPQALAGLGIEGEDPRVGAGDVDDAVVDDRLRLLSTLLLVAERVRPGRGQLEHVLVVDRRQWAPALGVGAHAVLQHVVGGLVVVGDVFPGHGLSLAGRGHGQGADQQHGLHGQRQRRESGG